MSNSDAPDRAAIICIAPDVAAIRHLLDALEGDGHQLALAPDFAAVGEIVPPGKIGLVLLGETLAAHEIGECCAKLAAHPGLCDVPVVAVIDHQGETSVGIHLAAGVADWVSVDANRAEFAARVRVHLDNPERQVAAGCGRGGAAASSLALLAGGIATDLNSILGNAVGSVALLKAKVPPDGELYPMLEAMDEANATATGLIASLVQFSRMAVGPAQDLDLNEEVRRAAPQFQQRGDEREAAMDLADGLPTVHVSPEQMRLVLGNLAVAAAKASAKEGQVEVETAMLNEGTERYGAPAELPAGRYVRLRLRSRGEDAPPEGDRLAQRRPSLAPSAPRGGLNLALAQALCRECGLPLVVAGDGAAGTVYDLFLPVGGSA